MRARLILRRINRAFCLVLQGGVTGCALIGALTTPPYVAWVIAPGCGAVIAGVAAILITDFPARSARRTILLSGVWATLGVPALAGVGTLGTAGAVIMFCLMVLAAIATGGRIVEAFDPSSGPTKADVDRLRGCIRVLPMSLLLHEWRATRKHLRPGTDPHCRTDAVLVRTLLLEEMSRRDPAGVDRWLSAGDQDAPERYLRDDWTASP